MRDVEAIRADVERKAERDAAFRAKIEAGQRRHLLDATGESQLITSRLAADVPDLLAALAEAEARADEAETERDTLGRVLDGLVDHKLRAEAAESALAQLREQIETLCRESKYEVACREDDCGDWFSAVLCVDIWEMLSPSTVITPPEPHLSENLQIAYSSHNAAEAAESALAQIREQVAALRTGVQINVEAGHRLSGKGITEALDAMLSSPSTVTPPEPKDERDRVRRQVESDPKALHAVVDELRELWRRALEREGNLASAVADVIWKTTPYGEREDGSIASYLIPSGTVHRLVGVAQSNGAHIPVAFRNLATTPPETDERPARPQLHPNAVKERATVALDGTAGPRTPVDEPERCDEAWHPTNDGCPDNVPPDYCGCECHA